MKDAETERLVDEMNALPDYEGWSFSYEYPGYFCYHHRELPYRVAFTPDWEGDEQLPIQVEDEGGHFYEEHSPVLPLPREGRTGEKLLAMVKPTLDALAKLDGHGRADHRRGRSAGEGARARPRPHGSPALLGGARRGDGRDRQGACRCTQGVSRAMFDPHSHEGEQAMMQRVVIEFVVEVPNMGVAGDVETRIEKEHHDRLCDVLQSVTGFKPMRAPGVAGLYVGSEPVTWNEAESDWIGPDDNDEDEDEEEEEEEDDDDK